MKKTGVILAISLFVFTGLKVSAQSTVTAIKLDNSPLDVSYYPKGAAHEGTAPLARVIYSRPQKKGRTIFGELEKYGKVWRTGANESTEIQFFTDVNFGGKEIPAGTYSLFTIPNAENWTVILNNKTTVWGAYSYDESKDVARVEVPVNNLEQTVEALTIYFEGEGNKAALSIAWDDVMVSVPVTFAQ